MVDSDSFPPTPEKGQPVELQAAFTSEREFEDYFKTVQYRIAQVRGTVFTDEIEAERALDEHVDSINDEIFDHPEWFKIPVVITGEGISEPNADSSISNLTDGRRAIVIAFDPEQGYAATPSFETKTGYIEGVYGQVISLFDDNEIPTGQHAVNVRYIVRAKYPETIDITLGGPNIAALRVEAYPAYFAHIDMVEIETEALNKQRQAEVLTNDMVLRGITGSVFQHKLTKVEESLNNDTPFQFMTFENIEDFRSVGTLGAVIARKGPDYARTVKEAMLNALRVGRPLKVDGTCLLPRIGDDPILVTAELKGEIYDIMLPESPEDTIAPTLVLSCLIETGEGQPPKEVLYFFDFEQIHALKF
ncbi:MAG: hypothetical protein ABIP50_02755 [Candidatus Saccharimonadales bacterium]